MKHVSLLTLSLLAAVAAQAQTLVYEDNFDNDGLDTNTGTGGGLTSKSLRGSNHNWNDTGVLQFVTTGNTHFENRVIAYTNNTFQSSGGFELTVDYFWTSAGGASALSFGLVSQDSNIAGYTGFHPYSGDTSVYSFGVNTENYNLAFTNASAVSNLDAAPTNSLGPALATNYEVVMSIVPDGSGGANWSWKIDDVDQGTGNIAVFDFTKDFHFVAYGQDDQGNKGINSVSLVAVPEPGTAALIAGLLGLTSVMLRRRTA